MRTLILTGDAEIFVVELSSLNLSFGFSDARKNERLALVVSVSADAQVHLVGIGASLEGLGDSQDGVWWAHWNISPERGSSAGRLDDSLASAHLQVLLSLSELFFER
jgi:hypothetical protein